MIIRTGDKVTPRPLHLDEIWEAYEESVDDAMMMYTLLWDCLEDSDYCIEMTPKEQFMLMVGVIQKFKKAENDVRYIFLAVSL
jgi:hypothetical protein